MFSPIDPSRETSGVVTTLWTFQRMAWLDLLAEQEPLVPTWDRAPANWRLSYEWMTAHMNAFVGFSTGGPPVWCWHSCGAPGQAPTAQTARLLLGDYEITQGIVLACLKVPTSLVLSSSYALWNQFVDHTIEHRELPPETLTWERMFTDVATDEGDAIQAVLPYLRREWVTQVQRYESLDPVNC